MNVVASRRTAPTGLILFEVHRSLSGQAGRCSPLSRWWFALLWWVIPACVLAQSSAPVITSPLAATGQVGVDFSYQITATQSPTRYGAATLVNGVWTIAPGISGSASTGQLFGKPTTAGTFIINLSATNAVGTGRAALVLTVAPATATAPPTVTTPTAVPVITSPLVAYGQVGVDFSYQITATNLPTRFGAATLVNGVWTIAPGLAGNTGSGLVYGKPTVAGTYKINLSATNSLGTGKAVLTLVVAPAAVPGLQDFAAVPSTASPPAIGGACPGSQVLNNQASLQRVWLAQTHLMEPHWPFFQLVENRSTLLKADVSAPAGTPVPTMAVTATFADGRSDRLCMRAPVALPTMVDMRPQPLAQDLGASYALTLPASWLQPGVTLRIGDVGGPTMLKAASELRVGSRPEFNLVLADVLLFGDTAPSAREASFGTELAGKLPVSRVTIQSLPFSLQLPRMVIGPRSDSVSPFGDPIETGAMWVDRKPACASWMKTAGTCLPHSKHAVWDTLVDLLAQMQAANGMSESSFWFGLIGTGSRLSGGSGWWATGTVALGEDLGKPFMHENGHSLGLPHLGSVTASRQRSSTGLRHPYLGEVVRYDGQYLGGGLGRTFAWDPIDNALIAPTCADTGFEKQEPVQRASCETVRTGRQLDHFSDASMFKVLRFLNGAAQVSSGTVPYYSALLAGSSADTFLPVAYQLPAETGRVLATPQGNAVNLRRWDAATQSYVTLLRPLGGDTGFLSAPVSAPAGSEYVQFYDFRFPQSVNVPVISVYGTFNYMDDTTSTIYAARQAYGNLMRLWDPTNAVQFGQMQSSVSRSTFWNGYDLHLRVTYLDGSLRHVALPREAKPVSTPIQGFTQWAVNLPDDGRSIVRIELLHRPLCSRDATATDRSCDLNLPANGITATNVYAGARIAAVWTP